MAETAEIRQCDGVMARIACIFRTGRIGRTDSDG
jgi:hypothetical protein